MEKSMLIAWLNRWLIAASPWIAVVRFFVLVVAPILYLMEVKWINDLILGATGLILFAYTFETRGMRLEMGRQGAFANQPVLFMSFPRETGGASSRGLILRNIGRGSALCIRVETTKKLSKQQTRLTTLVFDIEENCLEAGKEIPVKVHPMVEILGKEKPANISDSFDPRNSPDSYEVNIYYEDIYYEDITTRSWTSVMQMGKGRIKLLRHHRGEDAPL
jgi:hypothetical protein